MAAIAPRVTEYSILLDCNVNSSAASLVSKSVAHSINEFYTYVMLEFPFLDWIFQHLVPYWLYQIMIWTERSALCFLCLFLWRYDWCSEKIIRSTLQWSCHSLEKCIVLLFFTSYRWTSECPPSFWFMRTCFKISWFYQQNAGQFIYNHHQISLSSFVS